ncbi:hypothetical protein F3J37_17950 [Pantoea sp. Al-1710]|uniref:Uncharacterized protein n=1 Tax=Candidatus Pantoea communis TaxID=2608354 RepID=A0ABX0RVH5_9GAMM|nr:protein NinF [Pantoea communis]NIG20561.1 hypothetical protein [Pantoea communis]
MNAATAATPSSPVKTGIGMASHVSPVKPTSSGKSMSKTSPSNQPIGAGEQSALECVFCGTGLKSSEVYCCSGCADHLMESDPNFDMTGDDNGTG